MGAPCATTLTATRVARGRVRCRAGATKTKGPPANLERFRIETPWDKAKEVLKRDFGASDEELAKCEALSDEDLSKAYYMMQLCRDFENECNQAYMAGKIRGFMHLDNG
jgi:pyruvate dehydrogenase E1 component alpha subunit